MVRYAPLDATRNEIRLLVLLPGEARDDLVCTLRTVSLDSVSDFDAISYVWGDLPAKLPIRVDGEVFLVTANLEAALRALRKPREQRSVWVDAVCINQEDIQEKNAQVPQMGRIYSTARSVIMWLGPSTPNMELALSWMQMHVKKTLTSGSRYWLKLNAKAVFSRAAKRERDLAIVRALEGYYDIRGLPYWNRMWTFQEYLLPSEEPLGMLEGLTPFHITALVGPARNILPIKADRVLKRHSTTLLARARSCGEEERTFATSLQDVMTRIDEKDEMIGQNIILYSQDIRSHLKQATTRPLMNFMTFAAARVCSDERDKAFALYSLVPSIQGIYPPDYTKPVKVVMLETTAYLVNHECGLPMYGIFGLRDDRLSDTTYPSWVPDFGEANGQGPNKHIGSPRGRQLSLRLQSLENTPKARVTPDLTTLHLWARSLGECKVAFRFPTVVSEVMEQIRTLLQPNPPEFPENSLLNTIRKPETFVPRMACTCVAHRAWPDRYSTQEILEAFESIFEGLSEDNLSDRQMNCRRVIKAAADSLVGKSFLITPGGLFGIGLSSIKDGDVVVLPPEAHHSLVLTREASCTTDGPVYYRMVGTAVIDGITKGDLEDAGLVTDVEGQEIKEFLIH